MKIRTCALSAALLLGSRVNAIELDINSQDSIRSASKQVAQGMMNYYHGNQPGQTPGLLPDPVSWWQAGAMFGTLIDYWYYTGDSQYNDETMQGLLFQTGNTNAFDPQNQTTTEGNDDQAFWAMTALTAAELKFTNPPADKPQWLALAQAVFNQQAVRYTTDSATCGGGLRWQIQSFAPGWNYKSMITQGCFINIAARLGAYTSNTTYFDWANKAWNWTENIGLLSPKYEAFDGTSVGNNCSDQNQIQWTYNAGVMLYTAAVMYNQTNGTTQALWKTRMQGILDNTTPLFFKNGVMYEQACEPGGNCNVDQFSFKAYLARNMAATTKLASWTSDTILPLLQKSAAGAAQSCSGGTDGMTCGVSWTQGGYDGKYGVGQQMSALETIQSNLIVNAAAPVTNSTGGTSKGDAGAGGQQSPSITLRPITTGDRAGAGILTALVLILLLGGGWWLIT